MTRPYPDWLKTDLSRVLAGQFRAADIGRLHYAIGREFAEAARDVCKAHGFSFGDVDVIGSHGQTVGHAPDGTGDPPIGWTLQLGEPAWIAAAFENAAVVSNFRAADIAVGGQGAPLTPGPDFLLLRSETRSRAVLNIGGIANVTILPRACELDEVVGFDAGPGNMILDALVREETAGAETCDRDGRFSRRGRVCEPLLAELLAHPFFDAPPPKSAGRLQFGETFARQLRARAEEMRLSFADLMATCLELTARTAAEAIARFAAPKPDEILLCGGGARHPLLKERLAKLLPFARVTTTDEFGVPIDAREAIGFALLAYESFLGRPGNLPRVTGATKRVVLGELARMKPRTQ